MAGPAGRLLRMRGVSADGTVCTERAVVILPPHNTCASGAQPAYAGRCLLLALQSVCGLPGALRVCLAWHVQQRERSSGVHACCVRHRERWLIAIEHLEEDSDSTCLVLGLSAAARVLAHSLCECACAACCAGSCYVHDLWGPPAGTDRPTQHPHRMWMPAHKDEMDVVGSVAWALRLISWPAL